MSARVLVREVLPVSCFASVRVLSWQPCVLGVVSGRMVLDKMEYVGVVVGLIAEYVSVIFMGGRAESSQ